MALDIKKIGESIRDKASADEAGSTIHARHDTGEGSLKLSVDPAGDVEMTYFVSKGDTAVTIQGRDAIVEGPGGDIRYYRDGRNVEGEAVQDPQESSLVLSAMAMFDEAKATLKPEDLEIFNPFEDEPLG